VTVKIDMPGTSDGVDVEADARQSIDYSKYRDHLKRYGTALRAGDPVTVTLVKVKKDLIEFQLGGGGYGTFGDDTSTSVYLPEATRVGRSTGGRGRSRGGGGGWGGGWGRRTIAMGGAASSVSSTIGANGASTRTAASPSSASAERTRRKSGSPNGGCAAGRASTCATTIACPRDSGPRT